MEELEGPQQGTSEVVGDGADTGQDTENTLDELGWVSLEKGQLQCT